MRHRSPVWVAVFTWITLGIYGIYWAVSTKEEMNARGADIPTAWWIIVPFVNIWWLWRYSRGVEHVTAGSLTAPVAFVLVFVANSVILGVGSAILQVTFNDLGAGRLAAVPAGPAPKRAEPELRPQAGPQPQAP